MAGLSAEEREQYAAAEKEALEQRRRGDAAAAEAAAEAAAGEAGAYEDVGEEGAAPAPPGMVPNAFCLRVKRKRRRGGEEADRYVLAAVLDAAARDAPWVFSLSILAPLLVETYPLHRQSAVPGLYTGRTNGIIEQIWQILKEQHLPGAKLQAWEAARDVGSSTCEAEPATAAACAGGGQAGARPCAGATVSPMTAHLPPC